MARTTNATASSSRLPMRRPAAIVRSSSSLEQEEEEERLVKPVIPKTANGHGGRGGKLSNGAAKGRQQSDEEGEEEEEQDLDDFQGWTIETYEPRPLTKNPITDESLRKALESIRSLQEKLSESIAKASETAAAIEDCNADDPMIEEIAKSICRSIEIKAALGARWTVLNVIKGKLVSGEQIKVDEQIGTKTEDYMRQTARQKFGTNEDYIAFRENVWQVNHAGQPCRPMSHWLDRQEGDESDEELEMGPTMQNYKCSITHSAIKDAMYKYQACTAIRREQADLPSPTCKHYYSRQAIDGLFAQHHTGRGQRAQIKCPATGCNKAVVKSDLKSDPEFQAKADSHHFRETQREAQREEDEVEDYNEMSQED